MYRKKCEYMINFEKKPKEKNSKNFSKMKEKFILLFQNNFQNKTNFKLIKFSIIWLV